jgi:catechol 2,3-dioxygenase-like lactoylglutathione lyase family enzyme
MRIQEDASLEMRLTGVSHIPIGVQDIEKSLVFWRDFMGLSVTGDTGKAFRERRTVFLRWDEDQSSVFVSLSVREGREPIDRATSMSQLGVNHIAFWVEDLDAYVARADQMSIEVLTGPSAYGRPYADHDHGESFRTALFLDPDGVAVQLDERG